MKDYNIVSIYFRGHAQIVLALFAFIVRAYNIDNEWYQRCKDYLSQNRPRLSFKKLHQILYLEFMIAFCAK